MLWGKGTFLVARVAAYQKAGTNLGTVDNNLVLVPEPRGQRPQATVAEGHQAVHFLLKKRQVLQYLPRHVH